MRTTLTLDADVVQLIEETMHAQRRSMKSVINDALRRGLGAQRRAVPYEPRVHHSQLQPGIDAGRLNQLLDELDDEDRVAGWSHARP